MYAVERQLLVEKILYGLQPPDKNSVQQTCGGHNALSILVPKLEKTHYYRTIAGDDQISSSFRDTDAGCVGAVRLRVFFCCSVAFILCCK